jgi:DUF4097 and DUF4098 domain-containing protein YvlB
MNRYPQFATWLGASLGMFCALLFLAIGARGSDHSGSQTEEFHQTYTITADGRVELDNINGAVHISSWDRNEVKVDAVKYADTKERLDEAKIDITAGKDHISIRTKYADHDHTWTRFSRDNPAGVEYTLLVPRGARLDEIKLINGRLDMAGISGEVHASCINGRLEAHDLTGRTELSTVNGSLEATFERLSGQSVDLNSVNGMVQLIIPSDANADIEADTVSGGIDNDFGLHVIHHSFVGHNLRGEIGSGNTHIKLANVNGQIEIRHAQDGRTLSPVKDRGDSDDSEI